MDQTPVKHFPITIDGETACIGTANELAVALDVLHGHHDREVLEQLRKKLPEILVGPQGLARTLASLSSADQIFLIEELGPHLAGLIREARFLRDIFAAMSEMEVELKLLDTLGASGLRSLIHTAEEFGELLEWLYGECDRRAVELVGEAHLKHIVRHGFDLCIILDALDADGQRDLLERIGWKHAAGLMRDGVDLAHLLRSLPHDLSRNLLAGLTRAQVVSLIGNAKDWQYVWERIEPAERELIAGIMGVEHAE